MWNIINRSPSAAANSRNKCQLMILSMTWTPQSYSSWNYFYFFFNALVVMKELPIFISSYWNVAKQTERNFFLIIFQSGQVDLPSGGVKCNAMLHRMSTIINEDIHFNIACIRNFNNHSNLCIQYCLATLFLQLHTLHHCGSPRVELHCCAEMDGWLGNITWKAFACVYCNAVDCMQCSCSSFAASAISFR